MFYRVVYALFDVVLNFYVVHVVLDWFFVLCEGFQCTEDFEMGHFVDVRIGIDGVEIYFYLRFVRQLGYGVLVFECDRDLFLVIFIESYKEVDDIILENIGD